MGVVKGAGEWGWWRGLVSGGGGRNEGGCGRGSLQWCVYAPIVKLFHRLCPGVKAKIKLVIDSLYYGARIRKKNFEVNLNNCFDIFL